MVLKKNFLTEAEVLSVIKTAIDALGENEYEFGTRYNYVIAEIVFFKALAVYCIEGCDESDEKYAELFNLGAITTLLNEVRNAKLAYDLFNKTINKIGSIENIIDINLRNLLDRIPDATSLEKLAKKLPKEWQKAIGDYNSITGKDEAE